MLVWMTFLSFIGSTILGATFARKDKQERDVAELLAIAHKGESVVPRPYGGYHFGSGTISMAPQSKILWLDEEVKDSTIRCHYCNNKILSTHTKCPNCGGPL